VGSPYAGHEVSRNHLGAAKPHALRTLDGQGVLGSLADCPACRARFRRRNDGRRPRSAVEAGSHAWQPMVLRPCDGSPFGLGQQPALGQAELLIAEGTRLVQLGQALELGYEVLRPVLGDLRRGRSSQSPVVERGVR